jgi:hypothetical protein
MILALGRKSKLIICKEGAQIYLCGSVTLVQFFFSIALKGIESNGNRNKKFEQLRQNQFKCSAKRPF